MKSIDWEAVKVNHLMHRNLSMAALAKKHHMRERTVREVAERDYWAAAEREARSVEIARQALVVAAARPSNLPKTSRWDSLGRAALPLEGSYAIRAK